MNQNIWGPHLWFSLHTISFTYPLKPTNLDKKNFKQLFEDLQHVIPCSVCKKNYIRHLIENPIDPHLNSRKDIVYWVIDIHNMVNAETGKKLLTYDTVIKKYETVHKQKINLNPDNEDYNYEHDEKEYEDTKNNLDNDIKMLKNNEFNNLNDFNKYSKIINIVFIIFLILLIINLFYLFFYSSKSKNN
jgi:predicted neutral ceramidase superfamily lipid hydrolase